MKEERQEAKGKRQEIGNRAVILPVVLFILLLVGLLAAGFSFRVHADVAATQASIHRVQTRLAAEAGIEFAKTLLAFSRLDMDRWRHNPDELHRVIVWSHDAAPSLWGTNEEIKNGVTYRFSLVADDPSDDERFIRIGLTDEAAKLNLNTAKREQLLVLVTAATADDPSALPEQIVDAIMDWKDEDTTPTGEAADGEGEYYRNLDKPYRIKNGPFDTVEELLLVKGVTGRVLYGEDFDRNGLLTPNEDDGDFSFPPDNQDNVLNRGLYPLVTVLSAESEVSNDNRQRIYLFGDGQTVSNELATIFPNEPHKVQFIFQTTQSTGGQDQQGGKKGKKGGGADGGGANPGGGQSPGDGQGSGGGPLPGGTGGPGGSQPNQPGNQKSVGEARSRVSDEVRAQRAGQNPQAQPGQQGGDPSPGGGPGTGGTPQGDGQQPIVDPGQEGLNPNTGDEGQPPIGGQDPGGTPPGQDGQPGGGAGSGGGGESREPIRNPAELLLPVKAGDSETPSPLTLQDLPLLMDRTTVNHSGDKGTPGLININTAPALVLRCVTELTPEQIQLIVELRGSLDAATRANTAWLVTQGVLDLPTFTKVAPQISARGQQFTIESLGYADHIGMMTRLQVVVDMLGPIAQPILYRDLTALGSAYPIREEDRENVRGR